MTGREIDDLIRTRRTCLRMAEADVEPAVVEELCRLAVWAPNHHRTEPWRFAAFTGEGRRALGDTIADVAAAMGAPDEKVAKARTKYLRAPLLLVVGCVDGDHDTETEENRAAVAAAVQNVLLAATARGLASFWGSVPSPQAPELLSLCGFEPGTHVMAAIYLGYPDGSCPPPQRTDPTVTWVDFDPANSGFGAT